MPGFDGTGPMGMGPTTGAGRGFCSPQGIGAARTCGFPPLGGVCLSLLRSRTALYGYGTVYSANEP